MYLSRVRVRTEGLDRNRLVSLLSGDAYANHQLLWHLFSEAPSRSFLFRQELERDQLSPDCTPRGLPLFYVLSHDLPEAAPGLLELEPKPFSPMLSEGDRLAFRLRANPTISRRTAAGRSVRHDVLMDAKTRCREDGVHRAEDIAHRMDEAAVQWLEKQGERAGFSLEYEPQLNAYRQHANRRKGTEIRFSSIDYEGMLRVTEPAAFLETLGKGLGRAKAFGCGLMMVRRV